MLPKREDTILKIIVREYVASATPVPSEAIARNYPLALSPATIRHEMAALEEAGYIARRHISSGGVPSDRGYRYYVESLEETPEISASEQCLIHHLFHQVERDLEEWVQLTAAILARLSQNAALVTPPKATESRLKHLELLKVREYLALLILVLRETRVKRQLLSMDEDHSQQELSLMAHRLNAAYSGLSPSQISQASRHLSPQEEQVTQALLQMMREGEEAEYEEPYLQGIRHMLEQPEFAQSQRMLDVINILEDRNLSRSILTQAASGEGVQVIIGEENRDKSLRNLSLIIARYGVTGEARGIIGVVGPTRMHYGANISRVRYLSRVMSQLLGQLYGHPWPQPRTPAQNN